jgi:hypothetical protein
MRPTPSISAPIFVQPIQMASSERVKPGRTRQHVQHVVAPGACGAVGVNNNNNIAYNIIIYSNKRMKEKPIQSISIQ